MTTPIQTLVYGVIGNPVKHSISPKIHQFWYDQHDIAARYIPLELADETPEEDLAALARSGFSGLNITLPYKTEAMRAASDVDEAAKLIGAVNTLTLKLDPKGKRVWSATNTDHSGFLWSLEDWLDDLSETAAIIGAGGAARAVAYALSNRGIKLHIVNRTLSRAEELMADLKLAGANCYPMEKLASLAETADLVINTISLGHSGGELALPPTQSGKFMDISYGAAAEPTLKAARNAGWTTMDGLPMLVGQAADAFKLWFDIDPDRAAALAKCREWTGT